MRYPGGKGKTYQHIINLMPEHRVYIETHLGGGAVMRHKRPAARSIGVDADARVIAAWQSKDSPSLELVCGRAEDFLRTYAFTGDELLYVDPPYHPATRRRSRVYACDYDESAHEQLLDLLVSLPCHVILSGYAHPLYDSRLRSWHTHTFRAKTHTDVRTETVWFNFERPRALHDARYVGDDFRQRQTYKRRMERLQVRIEQMQPVERAAFVRWLHDTYPL